MKGMLINVLLVVAIIAVAGAAGLFAAHMFQRDSGAPRPEEIQQADLDQPEEQISEEQTPKEGVEYVELDVPAVTFAFHFTQEDKSYWTRVYVFWVDSKMTTLSTTVREQDRDFMETIVEEIVHQLRFTPSVA